MTRTQEELNELKKEYEELLLKLKELSEDELRQVTGDIKESALYYTVQEGDTLSGISDKLHVKESKLIVYNNIKNPDYVLPGMVLKYYQSDVDSD